MNIKPETACDCYKIGHINQYPKGTQVISSNLTARGTRRENTDKVVFFGLQYFVKEYLIKQWNDNFFNLSKEKVVARFKRRVDGFLGPNNVGTKHIEDLHDLGYLPISIYALPEGSYYKLRIPCLVIFNTKDEFFWLTNYLETILSTTIWGPCTSATTAFQYKQILSKFAQETVGNTDFVPFQGHDFSYRGMFGMEAALMSGAGHLTSFVGTDTIPAIDFVEDYYNANSDKELVGCSVAATEHSVACSTILNFVEKVRIESDGTVTEDELMNLADIEYVKHLITEIYPTGIVSIVADSFDYWNTITNTARVLKDVIMSRDGKVVFRPDTGDPVKVVCGYDYKQMHSSHFEKINDRFFLKSESEYYVKNNEVIKITNTDSYYTLALDDQYLRCYLQEVLSESEVKGSIECLWDIFGGTVTEQGYKVLDSHVGLIYGDSITLQRATDICQGLKDKGFASTNIVFGIGSFTYQYVTRDTDCYAVKATFAKVNDKDIAIYKKPKTGDGTKNSAHGLVAVFKDKDGEFYLKDGATWDEVKNCELVNVFEDGNLIVDQTLGEIRERLQSYL
jgi:nicotinamide phosphoribosyltransferase